MKISFSSSIKSPDNASSVYGTEDDTSYLLFTSSSVEKLSSEIIGNSISCSMASFDNLSNLCAGG